MTYLDILHQYWGYPDFRGIQKEIIESIGAGKDTLGLMPTGGGKSLTFQIPALAQDGVCIVITPLIALMKDQVDHLRHQGIPAAAVYSGMHRDAIVATLENCVLGGTRLGFKVKNVFRMSFERKNLAYVVRQTEDKDAEMVHILQSVPQTAIIYCRSRKRTKDVAQKLTEYGISATWYHAGLEPAVKDQRQNDWQNDRIRVIVATNAFGMGIDKPDVRVVIHLDCPSSLEAYFQEAGRAGRDGRKAYAVLLYNGSDRRTLQKRVEDTFPPKEYVQTVYEHLAYFYQIGVGSGAGCTFEFPIDRFCTTFKHFPTRANAALTLLQRAGYIDYEQNPDTQARIRFLLNRDDLYRLDALSDKENEVVTALLRNYGGLFSDYGYVDESYIAQEAGLDRSQTYTVLVNLSKKRIINFIPRKNTPIIRYRSDRIDGADIVLDRSVYEDRKAQFVKRIHSVIDYAQNGRVCRSRQLLRYFGETKSVDCGQCDVCLSHTDTEDGDERKLIRRQLLTLLADGKKHHITEIRRLNSDWELTGDVMREMVLEEDIRMEGSFLLRPC